MKSRWLFLSAITISLTLFLGAQAQMSAHMPTIFVATMDGNNVVPDQVDSNGQGVALAVLDGNLLVVGGTYRELSAEVAVDIAGGLHIHLGAVGENGGVVFPVANDGGTEGTFSGVFMLDEDQVAALMDGLLYLNLHTLNNQPGEIRGQLEPQM